MSDSLVESTRSTSVPPGVRGPVEPLRWLLPVSPDPVSTFPAS
ncbi:MAG: hypothetical protein ACK53Y_07355 [bacterium]